MDDTDIQGLRQRNTQRLTKRALQSCLQMGEDSQAELVTMLNGHHARAIALAILDDAPASRAAVRRDIPLWLPFGERASLLYELVTDQSDRGVRRVKNLLDGGWDPNLAMEGTRRTALMQVTNAWNPFNRDLAAMLLAAGANPEARSVGGQSALDFAPVPMRNFIQSFVRDIEQDTTNRSAHTGPAARVS